MQQEQHKTNGSMNQNNTSVRVLYTGILECFFAVVQ